MASRRSAGASDAALVSKLVDACPTSKNASPARYRRFSSFPRRGNVHPEAEPVVQFGALCLHERETGLSGHGIRLKRATGITGQQGDVPEVELDVGPDRERLIRCVADTNPGGEPSAERDGRDPEPFHLRSFDVERPHLAGAAGVPEQDQLGGVGVGVAPEEAGGRDLDPEVPEGAGQARRGHGSQAPLAAIFGDPPHPLFSHVVRKRLSAVLREIAECEGVEAKAGLRRRNRQRPARGVRHGQAGGVQPDRTEAADGGDVVLARPHPRGGGGGNLCGGTQGRPDGAEDRSEGQTREPVSEIQAYHVSSPPAR